MTQLTELDTGEWLRRIRLANRTELGLEGPSSMNGNGMGDFLYVDPAQAGVPPPSQDLLAYYGAGRQGGTADGWQPSLIDGTTGTYPQVQLPTQAQYTYQAASGQAVSGMGAVGVSAELKAQATVAVKQAAAAADAFRRTGVSAVDVTNEAAVRAQIQAAQNLLGSANWTDSSWGIVGPAYSSRADLLKQLTEARVRFTAKTGAVREDGRAMINPAAADPRTGVVRVDSATAAAAQSLSQSARATASEWADFGKSLSKVTNFFLGTPTRVVTTTAVGLGIYGLFFTDTGANVRRKVTGSLKGLGGRRKKSRRRRNAPKPAPVVEDADDGDDDE